MSSIDLECLNYNKVLLSVLTWCLSCVGSTLDPLTISAINVYFLDMVLVPAACPIACAGSEDRRSP